jgi:hypothetical protein
VPEFHVVLQDQFSNDNVIVTIDVADQSEAVAWGYSDDRGDWSMVALLAMRPRTLDLDVFEREALVANGRAHRPYRRTGP